GIIALQQQYGDLHATTYAFAPMTLEYNGFAMILYVHNDGTSAASGVQAFSLHNFHLGFGRPGSPYEVGEDNGSNGETLELEAELARERGFAGVVVARALGNVAHAGSAPGQDVYGIVAAGGDLPDNAPATNAVDDAVSAFQFELGTLEPGEEAW